MSAFIPLPVYSQDPPPAPEWTCETCKTKQEVTECKECGRPLCENCFTSLERRDNVCRECVTREVKELFTLLRDCELALMRIQRNVYRRELAKIGEIVKHYLGLLKKAGI